MIVSMKLKTCEVGMFRLPGIVVERPEDTSEVNWTAQLEEMDAWAEETRCGKRMTDYLWSFRNEKQRDMFILKWSGE